MFLFNNLSQKHKEKFEQYIEHFFDNNQLKKEDLRIFILDQFNHYLTQLHDPLHLIQNHQLWTKLSDQAAIAQNDDHLKACQAITTLDKQVQYWIKEGVETPQRFEFFILSKAAQLNSGDQNRDYYHAMLIRHDQLLAVNHVLGQAIKHITNCLKLPQQEIRNSDDFRFFYLRTIEERIFKTAQLIYKTRKSQGKL